MHGRGFYTYADGREYLGNFALGKKNGIGNFSWPNGNRYTRDHLLMDSVRVMVFFSGAMAPFIEASSKQTSNMVTVSKSNQMISWNCSTGRMSEILQAWSIWSQRTLRLSIYGARLDVSADSCINGLAHGRGVAVSLDGDIVVIGGRFVLGQMVAGELINIPRTSRGDAEAIIDG